MKKRAQLKKQNIVKENFADVDMLEMLEKIIKQNTIFYQSDLDYDKEFITKTALSPMIEDRNILWLSRPLGTDCSYECEVFVKDSPSNYGWIYYAEPPRDNILAYSIEVKSIDNGIVKGNVSELDYMQHVENFQKIP